MAPTADGDVVYSGAVNPRLKWFRMGIKRSSSSRRGKALAVCLKRQWRNQSEHTSKAASRFAENSATIRLCCSETGRNALPLRRNTLRFSTRSGTRSKSTWHIVRDSRSRIGEGAHLEKCFRLYRLLTRRLQLIGKSRFLVVVDLRSACAGSFAYHFPVDV